MHSELRTDTPRRPKDHFPPVGLLTTVKEIRDSMLPPGFVLVSFAFLLASLTTAFAPAPVLSAQQCIPSATTGARNLASDSNEVGAGSLFGGLFSGGQNKKDAASADPYWNDPNRGILMFEIPLDAMKVGGLRIALSLHCIGQQNTPNKGTWLARQCDDGVIEMWFNNPDQSGMFSITLTELAGGKGTIAVERHGPRPSLVYQLQECLQLHKVLDELETLAFGNNEEVEDENRLLVLKEDDGIEAARGMLPARQEE